MKTTKQHFIDTLPEDIAKIAIKNTNEQKLVNEFDRFETCLI